MRWSVALGLLLLTGCTTLTLTLTLRQDAGYFVPLPVDPEKRLDGRALVLTTPEDDAFVFSGRPTGFVGSAGTLVVPIGRMAREAALNVFGSLFREGAEAATTRSREGAHALIVSPRVERFSYSHRVGGVFRPVVALSVTVMDRDGRVLDQRTLESPAESFGVSGDDAATVEARTSRALHVTLQKLMLSAACEARRALLAAKPGSTAAPAP